MLNPINFIHLQTRPTRPALFALLFMAVHPFALAQHRHDRRHDAYCPVLPVAQPAANNEKRLACQ